MRRGAWYPLLMGTRLLLAAVDEMLANGSIADTNKASVLAPIQLLGR